MKFTPAQMAYDMGASFTSLTPLPLGVPLSPTSPSHPGAKFSFSSTTSSPSAPFSPIDELTPSIEHLSLSDAASYLSDEANLSPTVGAGVEIIPRAPYGLAIIPAFAPRINLLISAHVDAASLADHRTKLFSNSNTLHPNPPSPWSSHEAQQMSPDDRRKKGMRAAFEKLKELAGEALVRELELQGKDPISALSYSLRPKAVEEDSYQRYFLPCLEASQRAKGIQV